MALTIQQLFAPSVLPTSVGVIFTSANTLKNGRVRLTNTTAASISVTLYAAASGTASSAANCCMNAKAVAPNDYLDVNIPTLAPGDTFRALASAAGITIHELGGVLYAA